MNKNKNPVAENAIKEFHKERLRMDPAGGYVNEWQLAVITRNINSRIRKRGLSAKEVVLHRDQITNLNKEIVDDSQLAKDQYNSRVKAHNKVPYVSDVQYSIGDNVFLRNDKSKVRGREMYKITDIYLKDQESWAKVQKCESQFRAKDYEVKLSEIIPISGFKDINSSWTQQSTANDPVQNELQSGLKDELQSSLKECYDNKTEGILSNDDTMLVSSKRNRKSKRKRRKAAEKADYRTKDLIDEGLLMVQAKNSNKIPTHAWDWEEFSALCEMEVDSYLCDSEGQETATSRRRVPSAQGYDGTMEDLDCSKSAFDEFWDSSAEQYELTTPGELEALWNYEDSLIFHSTAVLTPEIEMQESSKSYELDTRGRVFAIPSESSISDANDLTSEPSDDEVFPIISNRPLTRSALKRSHAIRRKRKRQDSIIDPLERNIVVPPRTPLRRPTSPLQVANDKKQDLSQALSNRRPLVAEAVNVRDLGAHFLDHALQDGARLVGDQKELESLPYLRPGRKVSYRTFYNSNRQRGGGRRRNVAE